MFAIMEVGGEDRGSRSSERYGGDGAGRALRGLVSAAFGVSESALVSESRGTANVAFARQVAMYLAHTHLRMPLTAAGRIVRRDRTTARHACHLVEDRRDDPRVDELLVCLENGLNAALTIARLRRNG